MLLVRREDVDQPVYGLRRVLGVQRGQHEVTGLGRRQRHRRRLEVAQLADQDDVGVLAQCPLERLGEARSVAADLTLVHQASRVLVHVLDRVLDGHDVGGPRAVGQVEDAGQRRRLAGAGRPGDEHEAARQVGERRDRGRQAELLDAPDVARDQPHRRADAPRCR